MAARRPSRGAHGRDPRVACHNETPQPHPRQQKSFGRGGSAGRAANREGCERNFFLLQCLCVIPPFRRTRTCHGVFERFFPLGTDGDPEVSCLNGLCSKRISVRSTRCCTSCSSGPMLFRVHLIDRSGQLITSAGRTADFDAIVVCQPDRGRLHGQRRAGASSWARRGIEAVVSEEEPVALFLPARGPRDPVHGVRSAQHAGPGPSARAARVERAGRRCSAVCSRRSDWRRTPVGTPAVRSTRPDAKWTRCSAIE